MSMFVLSILIKLISCELPTKCVENGYIAITFDDGPTAHTEKVLDQLDELGVVATFHFTVQNIVRSNIAGLMRRAVAEGHTVGLRVNPGRNYDSMESDSIQKDIEGQIRVLTNETGEDIKFARAPAPDNMVNEDVYEALKKEKIIQSGYTFCFYHDAENSDQAVEQLEKIMETSSPSYESFIFLLHEEMEKSFPLLEDIVRLGKKHNYEFVTLDDCLKGYKPGESMPTGKGSALKDKSSANPLLIVPLTLLCFLFI